MPLQITDEIYNSLPALYANVGKWVTASVSFRNCYRAGSGVSNAFSTTSDALIKQSGTWFDDGFIDGDTVSIFFKKNGQNVTFTRTISYINGNTMFFTAALPTAHQYKSFPTSGTYTGMFVTVSRQPSSVDFRFNLGLSGSNALDSIVDGELNRFINNAVSGLAIAGSVNLTQLGYKSGGYLFDVVLTRNANTTFTNSVTNGTATEYNYTIAFKFYTWGQFQSDNGLPVWFNAAGCLNPVVRVATFPQVNTANGQLFGLNGSTFANTGWYNENFNGFPTVYTLTSIDLTDSASNSLPQIAYNQTTHVTAVIAAPNQLNGTSTYRLGLQFTPFDDDLYKNLPTDYAKNCLVNAPNLNFLHSGTPDATLRTGFENSDGARFDLQNIQFSHSSSVLTVDFDIIPDSSNEAFFDGLADGLRNLQVFVKVSNHATDGTQQSDETHVLIYNEDCYNAPRIGVQYPDVVADMLTDLINEDITSIATPNTTTEDALLYTGTLLVDDDQEIDGIRVGIVCRNTTTNESFILEEVFFDFANVPFIGGIYQVNETINRGFLLPPTTDRNVIKLTRDSSLDAGGQYGLKIEYSFLNRWEYWFEQANVDNDLFDISEPFNGKNKNWQKLQQGDWQFNIAYFVRIEGVDDFNYTPFKIRPYEDDPNIIFDVTYTDANGDIITALPNTGIVHVEAEFTWNDSWSDEWAEITVETFEGARIGYINTIQNHDGQQGNCLIPLSTELRLKDTISPPQVLTCECLIDCSQISGQQVSLTFRAHSAPKDDVGYIINTLKDADLAYSFRRVANTSVYPESEPGVRLYRMSDGVEQDFPFVDGKLDQTEIITFAGASELRVHTLYDQSGSGRHARQSDPTKMYSFYNAGFTLLNGRISAIPDGVDDYYNLVNPAQTSSLFAAYSVFNRRNADTNVFLGADTNDSAPIVWKTDNTIYSHMDGTDENYGTVAIGGAATVHTFRKSGNDQELYWDNILIDAITTGSDIAEVMDVFGKRNTDFNENGFCEFIYWRKDKSVQMPDIIASVNEYYGTF